MLLYLFVNFEKLQKTMEGKANLVNRITAKPRRLFEIKLTIYWSLITVALQVKKQFPKVRTCEVWFYDDDCETKNGRRKRE